MFKSTNRRADMFRITILSNLVLLALFFVPVVYMGDSGSYLKVARIFAGQMTDNTDAYFRTPGYPLLLLATGVVHLNSFVGIVTLQVMLAAWIPVVIYVIVSGYSRRVAWATALFAIASLVPYGYAKTVMTEHVYIVALLALMASVHWVMRSERTVPIYAFAASLFMVQVIRPVGTFLFVPCALVLWYYLRPCGWRVRLHLAVAVALIPVAMAATTAARNAAIRNPRMAVTALNPASGTGKQLFYNVYLTGGHLNNTVLEAGGVLGRPTAFIADDVGPGCAELRRVLTSSITTAYLAHLPPQEADVSRAFAFGRFDGRPDALVQEMLTVPSVSYYWYLWRALDDILGPQEADRVLQQVSVELLRRYPMSGLKFLGRNLYFFASGVSIDYVWALHPNYNLKINQSNLGGLVAYTPVAPDDVLTPGMAADLAIQHGGTWATRIRMLVCYNLWTPLYLLWRPVVFLGLLLGPWLLWRTNYAPVAVMGATVVLYHMAIVCIFCMPVDRYVAQTILVEFLVAGPAWAEAFYRLRRS